MRNVIKRNSKKFLFLILCSVGAVLGGILNLLLSIGGFLESLYLILAGIGLFLLAYAASIVDEERHHQMVIYSYFIYAISLFIGGYMSFIYGHMFTAKVLGICGVLVVVFTIFSKISLENRRKGDD